MGIRITAAGGGSSAATLTLARDSETATTEVIEIQSSDSTQKQGFLVWLSTDEAGTLCPDVQGAAASANTGAKIDILDTTVISAIFVVTDATGYAKVTFNTIDSSFTFYANAIAGDVVYSSAQLTHTGVPP